MERAAVRRGPRGRGWRCRCERAIGCGGGRRCTGERICTIQGTSGSRRPRARPGLPLLRLPKCSVFALPIKMSVPSFLPSISSFLIIDFSKPFVLVVFNLAQLAPLPSVSNEDCLEFKFKIHAHNEVLKLEPSVLLFRHQRLVFPCLVATLKLV